jgi:hypothetical protein
LDRLWICVSGFESLPPSQLIVSRRNRALPFFVCARLQADHPLRKIQATDVDGNHDNFKSGPDATTQTPSVGLPEDADRDGQVDCLDIVIVEAAIGSAPFQPNWNAAADVNCDGVVTLGMIWRLSRGC